MTRNRYTQLVHKHERLRMVRLEKRLIALVRELRSGVDMPIDPVLLPINPKISRATRREQTLRYTAEQAGNAADRIINATGREGTSAYQRQTRRPARSTKHLAGRSPS